ncbi:hypothetical protein ACFQ0G_53525 [Streptomyces chiangmaiensis]|uniref:hypothetical protein n=1 Tax=Streptomyces chiangmaiensis TaxID=766497 RepID=UPI0031E6BED1
MSTTAILPKPAAVAERALEILGAWMADPEMGAVLDGCKRYSSDWSDDYGDFIIDRYNVDQDAAPRINGAIRVMSVKSAVYEPTGDEVVAELPVPVPLDVTCHALTAQFTALSRVQQRTGRLFVHSTINEHLVATPWRTGDYTQQVYEAAFGPVDARYWIDAAEAERRRQVLDGVYASIGITDRGMTSAIAYAAA